MVTVALKPVTGTTNQRPIAAFSSSCTDVTCSFDATDSVDPDGSLVSYRWQFGDGATAIGATRSHSYGAYGTYPVTLTVTDNDGATDSVVQAITVTDPGAAAITFVGSRKATGNSVNHKVEVPAGVRAGDTLLLFFSANSETVSVSNPTGVTGWDRLDAVSSDTMQTVAWTKAAEAGDAGTTLTVALGSRQKGTLTVAAYAGTDAASPIHALAAAPETTKRNRHTTPQVTISANGAWIVSYWADKTSATTDWTLPAGEVARAEAYTIGGGRITSILGDSGQPHAPGTYGNKTATASSANAKATMWTVALRPSP
jgi:PKD repeat protein